KSGVSLKIVRSGYRNMLSESLASVVSMSNPILNNKLSINNNSKVINATAVDYKEKWQTDNDVFKKYINFYNAAECLISQVENCEGYLENSINPYVKGLLGTFRVSKSKIFYDNRKETNPLIKSNIATNGILENFKLYWDFNELNNLVSDDLSSQWVWNSEVTRVNARGLELETKDALNRYTTAQYGFSKSSPVAILQNASYGEGFNEGFEDYRYNEMINKVQQAVCESRYVSFNETSNSAIVNMDSMQLNAHSGKSALRINGNSVATSQIILTENAATGFNLTNENDTTSYLDEVGINKDNLTIIQHGVTSSQTN